MLHHTVLKLKATDSAHYIVPSSSCGTVN